jgi:hypothetical protein
MDLNNEESPASVLTLLSSSEYPAAELTQLAWCPRYIASAQSQQKTTSNSFSIVVMGGCLAIAQILFLWEHVCRAIAQKRPFVYSPVA